MPKIDVNGVIREMTEEEIQKMKSLPIEETREELEQRVEGLIQTVNEIKNVLEKLGLGK